MRFDFPKRRTTSRNARQPMKQTPIGSSEIDALLCGRHNNPFSVLGLHHDAASHRKTVRTFQPGAGGVSVVDRDGATLADLEGFHDSGLFWGDVPDATEPDQYRLRITAIDGTTRVVEDPYRFPSLIPTAELSQFATGEHERIYQLFGAHYLSVGEIRGVRFATWAPNANRVSVVGDFNHWDGRRHVMRRHPAAGVWEIFIPDLHPGAHYKFEIQSAGGGDTVLKSDPLGFAQERPPRTNSVVWDLATYEWHDQPWMEARQGRDPYQTPVSIYEVHLGSWCRHSDGSQLDYGELADRLIPHALALGFTHLELMPVSEHPFDGSWGYQPIGLFAPTARFGDPDQFRGFIDHCHRAGLGVIVDWVPGHFPGDVTGLTRFDGTCLYEHEDPRQGTHPDWDTLIYNYGRREVASFLLSNAVFWFEQYHVDALRVDAVASMLYLDYSRPAGEWIPNPQGGRENLDAVAFLKRVNEVVYQKFPGIMTFAEESTAWPGVSHPTDQGGLGFGFKWNMGWMHDTLSYMRRDPVHRTHHQRDLTFGLMYAFDENFLLPLSHDEVVHGKGSLLGKMPGDVWQKFANLRAYLGFMWSYPGKKLLFMGAEFAQSSEWNHDLGLDWNEATGPLHHGMTQLVRDLNLGYATFTALHAQDCRSEGFEWIDANDHAHSTLSFIRWDAGRQQPVVVVCNFTPVPRRDYRVGVPRAGHYREILNTDSALYGGSNLGNLGGINAEPVACHGQPHSVTLSLPPLSTLWFRPEDT